MSKPIPDQLDEMLGNWLEALPVETVELTDITQDEWRKLKAALLDLIRAVSEDMTPPKTVIEILGELCGGIASDVKNNHKSYDFRLVHRETAAQAIHQYYMSRIPGLDHHMMYESQPDKAYEFSEGWRAAIDQTTAAFEGGSDE